MGTSNTSRVTGIAGAIIGLVQAVILLVNAFGWATITGDQGAALTAVITAAVVVVASRKVNDQVSVALYTKIPVPLSQVNTGGNGDNPTASTPA